MKITKSELLRRVQEDSFIATWNRHRHPKNRNLLNLKPKQSNRFMMDFCRSDCVKLWDFNETSVSLKERFEVFSEVSKTLNPQLFWVMFGNVYIDSDFSHQNEGELREMITKQRMGIPMMDRIKLSNFIWATGRWLQPPKQSIDKEIGGFIKKIKRAGVNNYLTVYRGFDIKKEEGIPIKNLDVEGQQIFGKGFSYSLSRDVAVLFATRHNIFNEIDCNMRTNDKFKKNLPEIVKHWKHKEIRDEFFKFLPQILPKDELVDRFYKDNPRFKDVEGFKYGDDVRSVVATYTIHKKDIISLFNYNDEQEIFALPENVKLKRYDFLTIKDFHNPNRFTFPSEEELFKHN